MDIEKVLDDLLLKLGNAGGFQGSITGPTHTELLFSGANFEVMKQSIQKLLDESPWAEGAIVEQVA